jgi:hypothetical protein
MGSFDGRLAWIEVVCEQQLGYWVLGLAQCEAIDRSLKQSWPGIYIFGQNVFPNHCQTSNLRTRTEMVFETLVCSPLNHLTRLIARENFIIQYD